MARTEARIKTAIWNDKDFCALSAGAQRMYHLLLEQAEMSLCGVVSITIGRWSSRAKDTTPDDIRAALEELAKELYVVVDYVTEEVWVRTFVKHDGILDSPNSLVGMTKDFAGICSDLIREGFINGLGEGFLNGLTQGVRKRVPDSFVEAFTCAHAGAPPPTPPPTPTPLAPASAVAEGDDLHAAVLDACGIDPEKVTPAAAGAHAKAVNDLRAVEAKAAEVAPAVDKLRSMFSTATVTPSSLAKHWPQAVAGTDPKHAADMARSFGANRRAQGIFSDENEAQEAFVATYRSQPDLAAAAMDGWREAVEVPA